MKSLAWMPAALALAFLALPLGAKEKLRYMEKLDRGLVAVQQSDGKVFLSWRLLASDPAASRSTCIARRSGNLTATRSQARANRARSCESTAPHGRNVAARLGRPPRSRDSILRRRSDRRRRTAAQRAVSLRGRRARAALSLDRVADAGRLHAERRVGRRSRRRRPVRNRAAPDRRGERQLAAGRHRCADFPGLQTRWHPALDDQSRAQRPRRRALHPVPRVRLRRRRTRRVRLQDRRRHHRRHRQGAGGRERQLADARIRR